LASAEEVNMIVKEIMRNGEFWMTETSFHHYCKLFANGMVGGVGALDLVDGSNAMSLPARLCLNLPTHTNRPRDYLSSRIPCTTTPGSIPPPA